MSIMCIDVIVYPDTIQCSILLLEPLNDPLSKT